MKKIRKNLWPRSVLEIGLNGLVEMTLNVRY